MTGTALLLLAALVADAPAPALHPEAPQFFAVSVADAAASARWYQETFGLAVRREIKPPEAPVHVFILESRELIVELLQHPDARPLTQAPESHLIHGVFKVGFSVPDLAAAVQALKARGVTFAYDITHDDATGLRFAIFKDNSGNLLQIFERRPAGT